MKQRALMEVPNAGKVPQTDIRVRIEVVMEGKRKKYYLTFGDMCLVMARLNRYL
jgi:hypothetical protein